MVTDDKQAMAKFWERERPPTHAVEVSDVE
jgi:hypothetical protein